MGADFSRVRLNPLLDFAAVELKQGGVILDADANELVGIMDRRLRALASDILGRARVSSTTPDAFKITVAGGNLTIGKGRLYVDGLLAENHGAADAAKRSFDDLLSETQFADPIDYLTQPYFPDASAPTLPTAGRHLVYLDVWDREVTHLESARLVESPSLVEILSPDLVETAVGVETSSRVQTVWQVRVLAGDLPAVIDCGSEDADVPGWTGIIAPSTGVLTTGTFEVAPKDDPCELPPTGGYRGLENQLYRVEIQNPGQPGAGATFKWSRENASVGSRVASVISDTELELETLGRDDVLRFNTGDWVEIIEDVREFVSQSAGEMRRITVPDATPRIQFTPALPPDMLPTSFPDSTFPRTRHLRVRRWDQKGLVFRTDPSGTPVQVQDLDSALSKGVINVPPSNTTLLLENGVTVRFASTGARGFLAGDYWVFAARTADASVEILDRAPPRGIHHHYAKLGIWDVAGGTVTDCRNPWPPLVAGHDCGCTACVSPESHASGQFTIQDAVNQLAQTGGTVCLGLGQYALTAPVRVLNGRSLRIRGQGSGTVVTCPGGAFELQDCIAVVIENLAILSFGSQSAVTVRTALGLSLRQLVIAVLGGEDARGSAISLQGVVAGAEIRDNAIIAEVGILANDPAAVPPPGEQPALNFLVLAAVSIEHNALWCQRQAITLSGTVLHVLGTHIADNELVGCRETAIAALGVGADGSSFMVSRNSFNITGSGISCSLNGLWIEANKLFNMPRSEAGRHAGTTGVALVTGLDKSGIGEGQILANQITGFSLAGIRIGTPVRDLIVKMNIIENCGNGIVSVDDANAGSISIENNRLRNIGPSGQDTATVTGIGVTRAQTAVIAGNSLRAVGLQSVQSSARAGIVTVGTMRTRIHSNEVTELAPPAQFIGPAAGIMVRAPFMDFEVSHNRVQRDLVPPAPQASAGDWSALIVADINRRAPVDRVAGVTIVIFDPSHALVLGAGRAYVAAFPAITSDANEAEVVSGSILGNAFNARGQASAVQVSVAGECLFNDNRVDARFNRDISVEIAALIAIVNANRVTGHGMSIVITSAKAAAILGNITTRGIQLNGGTVPAHFDVLNLTA